MKHYVDAFIYLSAAAWCTWVATTIVSTVAAATY